MKKELKNILMPVDFKEPSLKSFKYAHNLALKLDGELILLNVIETPGFFADLFTSEETLSDITNQAKQKLSELAKSLTKGAGKVKISWIVEKGKPYKKILEVAHHINARFIILGENHQGTEQEKQLLNLSDVFLN